MLLKSIQVQLKARGGHPLTSILELCEKIKSQIQDEQTEKQTEYEAEKTECQDYVSGKETEISSDEQSIVDNNKEMQSLQSQLDSYQTDLENAETLKESKQNQLDSLEEIRTEENQAYQQEVSDLNEMVEALREGKTILQQLVASATNTGSFFEKNQLITKPNHDDLNRMISLFEEKKNGYFKMSKILFEMVAKQDGEVDQQLLNNVLELIDELITQLLDNIQTKNETEDDRKQTYETEKNTLESSLNVVTANINDIQTKINEINNELLNLNQDNIDLQNKIESNTLDKETKEAECTDYYHTYVTESQNRFFFI